MGAMRRTGCAFISSSLITTGSCGNGGSAADMAVGAVGGWCLVVRRRMESQTDSGQKTGESHETVELRLFLLSRHRGFCSWSVSSFLSRPDVCLGRQLHPFARHSRHCRVGSISACLPSAILNSQSPTLAQTPRILVAPAPRFNQHSKRNTRVRPQHTHTNTRNTHTQSCSRKRTAFCTASRRI